MFRQAVSTKAVLLPAAKTTCFNSMSMFNWLQSCKAALAGCSCNDKQQKYASVQSGCQHQSRAHAGCKDNLCRLQFNVNVLLHQNSQLPSFHFHSMWLSPAACHLQKKGHMQNTHLQMSSKDSLEDGWTAMPLSFLSVQCHLAAPAKRENKKYYDSAGKDRNERIGIGKETAAITCDYSVPCCCRVSFD